MPAVGRLSIYAVLLLSAMVSGAFVAVSPLLASDLDLSEFEVGLSLAAPILPLVFAATPIGQLGDRHSLRTLTVLASALMTIATVAQAYSPDIGSLVALRALFGLGSAILWTVGLVWLTESAGPRSRARVLTSTISVASVGVAAGPAFGGIAADQWSVSAPFVVLAACLTVATVGSMLAPPAPPKQGAAEPLTKTVAGIRGDRVLIAAFVLLGLSGLMTGATNVLVPIQLAANGVGTTAIGLILTSGAIVLGIGSAVISSKGDRAASLKLGGVAAFVLAAGLVPVVVSASTACVLLYVLARSPAWVVLSTIPYALIAVGGMHRRIAQGAVIGLLTQVWAIASVVSPVVAGALADQPGPYVTYFALAVIAFAAGVWLLGQTRTTNARLIPDRAA